MIRWIPAAAIATFVLGAPAAYAQSPPGRRRSSRSAFPAGSIEGRVLDDSNSPVVGAMVSVVGRTTAAATTDRDGRYTLRELPYGPYILSVHSRGYFKSRGRTVQLTTSKVSIPEIQLAAGRARKVPVARRRAGCRGADRADDATRRVWARGAADLALRQWRPPVESAQAAVRTSDRARGNCVAPAAPAAEHPQGRGDRRCVDVERRRPEPRWFSRHSAAAFVPIAFFSELPLSGQLNLMTIESFDRPGEIFAENAPRSVAFVSVNTQAAGGAWSMQGAMTQGDLASWIVAGSYKSIESANHAYELGLSYSTQRYDGGNAAALGAIRESARNVGSVYGYDEWTVSPRLVLGYGTGYARYDYLGGPGVWSPRVSITVPDRRLPGEGARVAQGARARRRGVRAVGDRHVAAARAHVLVALARRALYTRACSARADFARARPGVGRHGVGARLRSARRESADRDLRRGSGTRRERRSATITLRPPATSTRAAGARR